MFSLAFVALVGGGELAVERAELNSAMTAVKRLVAAASVPTLRIEDAKTRREIEVASLFGPRYSELDAHVKYLDKFHSQLASGRYTASELFNFLQVAHDMVNAGSVLAPLAEEKLCWERAGLNLARAHSHIVKGQVVAGVMPSQSLNQADAQVARFEKRYRDALAKCLAPANAGK